MEQKLNLRVLNNGIKLWYNEAGQLHNPNGPAVEYPDGYKAYWIDGERHRADGPAIMHADSSEEWYLNGKRHRPLPDAALIYPNYKSYWVEGERQQEPK